MNDLGLVNFARPRLSTTWKYARVEMRPPGPSEWGQAAGELGQVVKSVTTGRFLQQTTKVSRNLKCYKTLIPRPDQNGIF